MEGKYEMLINHKRIFKLVLPVALLFTILLPQKTEAYINHPGKWNIPNDLMAHIDSTVTATGFQSATEHGISAWNSSDKIQVFNSTVSSPHIKWFASSADLGELYADCLNYSGGVPSWSGTYSNSVIRWNQPQAKKLDSNRAKETAAHEMGHALGIAHSDTTNAIMRASGWIYGTYPLTDDWNAINAKY